MNLDDILSTLGTNKRPHVSRCYCRTSDGRQCWREVGHAGKHLVIPRNFTAADAKRVMQRIASARPDLEAASVAQLVGVEMLAASRRTT